MSLVSPKNVLALLVGGSLLILLLQLFAGFSALASLVLLAGLIFTVIFLYNPKWGFFLILFIRPSIDKFGEQFFLRLGQDISLNVAAIFGIMTIVLLLLFILAHRQELRELPTKKSWILFLVLAMLSIIVSIQKIASLYEITRLLGILCVFAAAYILVKKEKNPFVILYALIFSAILPFIFATYQLVTQSGLGGTSGIESRLFGTFSHPNPFASFVLIILSVAFFLFLKEKAFLQKRLLGGFILWGLLILEQTYARGAWLAFLILISVVSFKKSPKVLFGLILFSVLLFFVSASIQERVEDIYNPPADSSVRWRFEQWDRMYGAFLKHPLSGYGIGTEIIVHEKEFGPNAGNQYTHNDFLRVALETGVFGFLAYFLLLAAALLKLWTYYKNEKNPWIKDFSLFALALFLAILSYSQTNNTLRETVTQWTLWGITGASMALSVMSKKDEHSITLGR